MFGASIKDRHYRQLFLFLGVLILPSVVIGVQGWRLSFQEEELSATRRGEIRQRTAAEIGQAIVTELERIKTREIANLPAFTPQPHFSNAAVVAVGWVDRERLLWPWDAELSAETPEDATPEFTRAFGDARRAEFGEHVYSQVVDLYRQADRSASHEGQHAQSRLGLARSLLRSGQRQSALTTYGEILDLPSSSVDENGISYWSSAALSLAELGEGKGVLARVNQELAAQTAVSPLQLYRLRTILDTLKTSSDPALQKSAVSAHDRLAARLADLEEEQNLQQAFPKLRLTSMNWLAYNGTELWLVGRSPDRATAKPLVLAVRWEPIRRALESDWRERRAGPDFQVTGAGSGDPLSEDLPDLRVNFPAGVTDAAPGLRSQRSFWGLAFVLVALLTFLGGYLLWRDVRRETHIAELRTQFVSSVSHELKTPLTSIRMFAELLQMRESNDDQQAKFLDTIVSESERLTRLLNNVLDFSRIERGQRNYNLQPASLCEVVQAAVHTIHYPLTQQGFVLDMNVAEGLPPVQVDRDAMQQAILNLLTNAMKYSRDRRDIGLRLFEKNGDVLIQVSDHGIGIPEKDLSRIFEKFYRVPTAENHEISGTGLGLSLVAHIAEAHGGRVQVESRVGEGSTFSIRLPLKAGGAA